MNQSKFGQAGHMARRESPWGAPSAGDRHQIRQIAEASGQVISDMVQGHIEGEMFVREDPGAFAMVETERPDNLLADFERETEQGSNMVLPDTFAGPEPLILQGVLTQNGHPSLDHRIRQVAA